MSSCLRGTGSDESLLCLRSILPRIDWVVQGAAGKSRRRRRKKSLGIQMIQMRWLT